MQRNKIIIFIGVLLALVFVLSLGFNSSTITWQNTTDVQISINQKSINLSKPYKFKTGQNQNIVITSKYLKPIIVQTKNSITFDIAKLQHDKALEVFNSSGIYQQLAIKKVDKSRLYNSRYLAIIYLIGDFNYGLVYDVYTDSEGFLDSELPDEISQYLNENMSHE